MPASTALRCSPARELRGESHRRGRSLENGLLFREKDDDLALFNEMQSRERENFLLQSTDDFNDSLSTKLRYFPDFKLGISVPVRGESSDLLNADGEKNDYDWLLTPPDTPLFPSLDDETPTVNLAHRGRPRSQPISISRSSTMEKSYRSSRGSASPHRSSPSPRSVNSAFQSRGRPSSAPQSSPTPTLRHATPSRRSSPPPSKPSTPAPRSSTPTPRRMSTASSSTSASSGVRGTSPVKANRGNSASPKIRAWQSNIPGFSSDAPPNLRTSLADRPASYVRGSSPASRYGRDSPSKFGRQSTSPTASRSISSSHSHDRDRVISHSKGSVASSGDDDLDSPQSIPLGCSDGSASKRVGAFSNNRALPFSKKPYRTLSSSSAPKRSLDSTVRNMDQRKSPQNMFRPLLSSVPSTTFYVGKASSAHRTMISRNSSVTTSSNASSDLGTSFAPDTEGSDQNHDDAASECGKGHEVQDEVFALEMVNEDIGQETHDGSQNIQHGDFDKGGPSDSECFCHNGTAVAVSAASEAIQDRADFAEVDSFEDTICSKCGCRYDPSDPVERDGKICPDCSRKEGLLTIATPVTTVVLQNSPDLSLNTSKEYKPLSEIETVVALPEPLEDADIGEPAIIQRKDSFGQSQNCYIEQSESLLRDGTIPVSLAGDDERQIFLGQKGMREPSVDYSIPHTRSETGGQQLEQLKDDQNSKIDPSGGTGISVLLLNRSNSGKGHVVQGRTFTASTVPCDDPSYARDSTNSLRISVGHGSASASSSVDLTSARQTEARVQRQLSGRKSDMENYRHDVNIKLHSIGSSFSGTPNPFYPALGLARNIHEENCKISVSKMEYDVEETPVSSQEHVPSSEDIEVDNLNRSFMRTSVPGEDNYGSNRSGQTMNASASELSSHTANSQLEENSAASLPNYEESVSSGEDLSKYPRCVSDVEVSAVSPECSFLEDQTLLDTSVDRVEVAEVPTHSSLATISEIEIENGHQNAHDSQTDVDFTNSKSSTDEFQELSVPSPSDKDLTTSVPEANSFDHVHDTPEESTVMLGGQGGNRARSLTLEEATDTILFCSSIVHNLAYQAATIAIDKENSTPLEGSWPTVTIVGKSSSDRNSRGRNGSKRSLRSQKVRQKRVETDHTRTPSTKTENDENSGESLTRNVGLPNKVDSNVKPPKLESKCNCTIM
ncbi:uncharacterized protein LOC131144706 [Malania oleifera]|uniref:uncharacterized protein LOC131144706 n=1 Tax=Malania oleifera TaxID=397392 RepID=UPI0025AE9295|nr:uncharacterized protein LOC131144706 [Malania oleifera]